jgi:hypothetical protein
MRIKKEVNYVIKADTSCKNNSHAAGGLPTEDKNREHIKIQRKKRPRKIWTLDSLLHVGRNAIFNRH